MLLKTNFFLTLIIHKPSLGSRKVPQKIWAQSVLPFIGYKQTNRQTDRQAKFIYRLNIDMVLILSTVL